MKIPPLVSLLAWWAASTALAAELKIELPPERTELKAGPHAEAAAANCVTCHSWDYVSIQPLLPRAAWKATVTKMRATFGAPIPEDLIDDIVDYLARTYGDEQPDARERINPPVAVPRTNGDVTPTKR